MDRGAWQATVHGVARAGHDLVIKPPGRVSNSGMAEKDLLYIKKRHFYCSGDSRSFLKLCVKNGDKDQIYFLLYYRYLIKFCHTL